MLVVNPNNDDSSGTATWQDRLRQPDAQRRIGWAMIVIAVVGVIAAVLGMIVAWRLIGSLDQATADTLDVTIDALDSIENTIEVADGTVKATSTALAELETTLSTLSVSLDTGGEVVGNTGQLAETAAPALADATATLRQMEAIGSQIDGFLSALANIPFTPDFDQERGLGPTFARLAEDIEPLDEEFATTARSLENFEGSLAELQTDIDNLVVTVGGVNQELAAGEELLVEYRANVVEARSVARESQSDLRRDQTLLRVLIVLAGSAFAAAQLVPLWLGLNLIADRGDADTPVVEE